MPPRGGPNVPSWAPPELPTWWGAWGGYLGVGGTFRSSNVLVKSRGRVRPSCDHVLLLTTERHRPMGQGMGRCKGVLLGRFGEFWGDFPPPPSQGCSEQAGAPAALPEQRNYLICRCKRNLL